MKSRQQQQQQSFFSKAKRQNPKQNRENDCNSKFLNQAQLFQQHNQQKIQKQYMPSDEKKVDKQFIQNINNKALSEYISTQQQINQTKFKESQKVKKKNLKQLSDLSNNRIQTLLMVFMIAGFIVYQLFKMYYPKIQSNLCIIMNQNTINENQEYFKYMVKQLIAFQNIQKELSNLNIEEKQQIEQKVKKNNTLKLIAFQQQNLLQKYQRWIQEYKQDSSEIVRPLISETQEKQNKNVDLEQYNKALKTLNKNKNKRSKIQFKILQTFHNKGENTYNAIHNHCHNDDIAIILNQGDQIASYQALMTIKEHFSNKFNFMAASHLIDNQGNVRKPQNAIIHYKRVMLRVDKRSQQQMRIPIQIMRFTRFFRVSYYKKIFYTKLMNYKLQFLNSTLSFLLPLSQNFQYQKNEPEYLSKFFAIPSKFRIIKKSIIKQNKPFKSLITQNQLEEIRQIQDKANLQNNMQTYLSASYTLNLTNMHLQTKRKIPKKIHQVQIGKRPMTQFYKYLRSRIQQHMGDYQYKLWTEEDLTRENFPLTYDYIQKLYQIDKTFQFTRMSMVVDLMKVQIIYQHGGIYLDKNVQLFKSLDHLTNFKLFSGRQFHSAINIVSVGVFGAQKNSPLIKTILTQESLKGIDLYSKRANIATGPGYFGKAIQLEDYYTGDLFVLERQSMYPFQPWEKEERLNNCACAVSTNQTQQSWPQYMKSANIKFQFIQERGFKIIKNCSFYKYSYSLDYFMFGGTWRFPKSTFSNSNSVNNNLENPKK